MGERSDADTRYFPDVVDRIANAWRDLGPDGARGRVVVVSGTPQSGRSTVLAQVAEDLRRAKIRVVRRAVRDGVLQTVDESGSGERAVQAVTVLGAALQVAGAGLVGGLVALGAEIAATRRMIDAEPARVPSDPYVHVRRVAEAVRERAAQEPLALLVDDADRLDHPDVWWDALFGTTLPRLAARLPVLVVLGVERTSTARSAALQVVDTRLLPAGLAEEVRLPPLDAPRIAAALGPVDDAVADQLRSLVYGRPAWLDEVWREWREQGVVEQRGGRWVLAPEARDRAGVSLHGWVEAALRAGVPDGDVYWRAKEILRTAALEGPRVTAEALALVLNEDVEDLIDWIDDHLADPDAPSLLIEDGFVERAEGVEPPALRCYRFRSAMVAAVLRQEVLAGTDGKVLAGRYARALAAAYQHSSVSGTAWTIGRLATTAGDEGLAEYIWRRSNRLEGLEAAAALAGFLLDNLDVETASSEVLAATVERLNGLGRQLTGQWDAARTLEICRGTEPAARALPTSADDEPRRVRHVTLLVDALFNVGYAAARAGERDQAVALLHEAAEQSTRIADPVRTANAYRLLANVELDSWSGHEQSLASARNHIVIALEYAARDASREAVLAQVVCLCMVVVASGPHERATRVHAVRRAVSILLGPMFHHALSSHTDYVFDCIDKAYVVAVFEGELAVGERFCAALTRCRADIGQCITALENLGDVRLLRGDVPNAARAAGQALRLAQAFSSESEGLSLLILARCASSAKLPQLGGFLLLARTRLQRFGAFSTQVSAIVGPEAENVLAQIDDASGRQIEHDYRADRGARLLHEAFGVDVTEIDALNERLGDATEEELRGFLLDVQEYCDPDPDPDPDEPTSGTFVG